MAAVRALDHFVLMTHDLERAAAAWERLGFHVRPVARHIELGSANCIVHFQDTYVELLSLDNADPKLSGPYLDRYRCGEGIAHVSLRSFDLEADRRWALAQGLDPTPIWSARRRLVLPDGREDETASNFIYMWRDDARYLSLFLSEHTKPETIFIPAYAGHANTAVDVARLVYMSADPSRDRGYFATLFGKQPDRIDGAGFSIAGARGETTEVLTAPAAVARYGAALAQDHPDPLGGFGVAMHYAVASLDACRNALAERGVAAQAFGRGLIVPAAQASGCAVVFEPGR